MVPVLLGDSTTDIWVTSNPGSGKTLAYALGVLSRIDSTKNYPQALCVAYSREAALQTANLLSKLAVFKNVKIGLAVRTDKSMHFE